MNEMKVAFIIAVNDEIDFSECKYYINSLYIPEGFEIEIIPVRGAHSMTSANNTGCGLSNAKYKVYLHQDVFIINEYFIEDMIDIFKRDEKIGAMGMCGPRKLPSNAIWWESSSSVGKVYESSTGILKLLAFKEVNEQYCDVEAVDGFLIATQYDLKWRDDIFDGWHFYDISQCFEFLNSGYKVVVPGQSIPWCVHHCEKVSTKNFNETRQIFIENYLI